MFAPQPCQEEMLILAHLFNTTLDIPSERSESRDMRLLFLGVSRGGAESAENSPPCPPRLREKSPAVGGRSSSAPFGRRDTSAPAERSCPFGVIAVQDPRSVVAKPTSSAATDSPAHQPTATLIACRPRPVFSSRSSLCPRLREVQIPRL